MSPIGTGVLVPTGENGTHLADAEWAGHRPVEDLGPAPAGAGVAAGRWVRVVIRWIAALTVIGVAACAARASYDHQRTVVEMAGERDAAWYLPLSVDGMMLVASLNMSAGSSPPGDESAVEVERQLNATTRLGPPPPPGPEPPAAAGLGGL